MFPLLFSSVMLSRKETKDTLVPLPLSSHHSTPAVICTHISIYHPLLINFHYSDGTSDGSHWNKANCPTNSSLNTTLNKTVENPRAASICTKLSRLTAAYRIQAVKVLSFSTYSAWKHQNVCTTWLQKLIKKWGTGWTWFVKCASFRKWRTKVIHRLCNVSEMWKWWFWMMSIIFRSQHRSKRRFWS